jgi:mRNA-degrading endonuclease HigB of HigAB toxin-antitoxin module
VVQRSGREAQLRNRQHRFGRSDRFNIKGNDYRLVVATDFDKGIVWIKWIGTHKDYDKIDMKEVRHGG